MERNNRSGKSPNKFVAQGNYGCVFRPPLPCQGDDVNQSPSEGVGKIFKTNSSFKTELEGFSTLAEHINTQNKFSPYFLKECVTDTSKMTPKQIQELKRCKFVEKVKKVKKVNKNQEVQKPNKTSLPPSPHSPPSHPSPPFPPLRHLSTPMKNYPQIIMEDGGIPIDELKTNFLEIFSSSKSLFEGISILQKNKKCHLDIKDANIVYNKEHDRMLLIDFGLMTPHKDVYKGMNLDINYSPYPPEFRFADFVLRMRAKADPYLQERVEDEIMNILQKDRHKYIDINYISHTKDFAMIIAREVKKINGNKDGIKLNVAKFYPESRNKELSTFASYFFKLYDEMAKKHLSQSKTKSITEVKKRALMMKIFKDELAKKIDSYALGVVFIYILGRNIQLGKIRIRKDNQNLLSSIIGLLEKMTHANPFERYDSIEAYKKYTEIMNKK